MNYKLKKRLTEINNNQSLAYMKNLILRKYAAKFQALRAKMKMIYAQYVDLQTQLYKELHEAELKVVQDIQKSIQQNKKKNPFRVV